MANVLEEILDRAAQDESFRRSLLADPTAATRGYSLTPAQVEELKAMIDALGGESNSKQRLSKLRLY